MKIFLKLAWTVLLISSPSILLGATDDFYQAQDEHELISFWSEIEQKAKDGDADAQFLAGAMSNSWRFAKSIPQNPDKSVAWLAKSSMSGNECAQRLLADVYRDGYNVPMNYGLARHYYKMANQSAGFQPRPASNYIAQTFSFRIICDYSFDEYNSHWDESSSIGQKFWKNVTKALEHEDGESAFWVSEFFEAKGSPGKYSEYLWDNIGTLYGHPESTCSLGYHFWSGTNPYVKEDERKAIRLFRMAKERGSADCRKVNAYLDEKMRGDARDAIGAALLIGTIIAIVGSVPDSNIDAASSPTSSGEFSGTALLDAWTAFNLP